MIGQGFDWWALGSVMASNALIWLPHVLLLLALGVGAALLLARHRTVALLLWTAVAVLLVRTGLALAFAAGRWIYIRHLWSSSDDDRLIWIQTGSYTLTGLLSALGMALLIAATFLGRTPPPPSGD